MPPNSPPVNPDNFRIQASAIYNYFSSTSRWYSEKLGDGSPILTPSTSTVLGVCLHWCADCYTKDGEITKENQQEAYAYIEEQAELNPEVMVDEVRKHLTPMWNNLKTTIQNYPLSISEPSVAIEILPNITVGGSIDGIRCVDGSIGYKSLEEMRGKRVTLVDWKTYGGLTAPTKMPKAYEWQLLVYAYVLKKQYDITVVQITNTFITRNNINRPSPTNPQKMLKDYPTKISDVSQPISDEDLEFIESIINLVAHSVQAYRQNPTLQYLLAQDFRLFKGPLKLESTTAELDLTDI